MRLASRRLKPYSLLPRALMAPGASALWPTSSTTRKCARSQCGADFGNGISDAARAAPGTSKCHGRRPAQPQQRRVNRRLPQVLIILRAS